MMDLSSRIDKLQSYAEDINIAFYDLALSKDKPVQFDAEKSKIDSLIKLLYSDWLDFVKELENRSKSKED